MTARVVLCCGSGGVGKTTVSAALSVKWAQEGARVAVLTIDPARRLAQSLGMGNLGNEPQPVPLDGAPGRLDAAMLEARATFDAVVRRLARSPEVADRILRNRYYQYAATGLGGSHEYMAQERLLELWQSNRYDIVVLDTPPTRQALDFLRAPERMASLMDEGVLRWLVMPASTGGWRALELGSEAVAKVLRSLLGERTVTEIGEFFEGFREIGESFRTRSIRVKELLRDPETRILLVTSPTATAEAEALYFLQMLRERGMPFGGFIVNRTVHPPRYPLDLDRIPAQGPREVPDWSVVRDAVARAPELRRLRSVRQADNLARLRRAAPGTPMWLVSDRPTPVADIQALIALADELPSTLW
jgi:anion-transporting  ArsA/GET3 family ATPase